MILGTGSSARDAAASSMLPEPTQTPSDSQAYALAGAAAGADQDEASERPFRVVERDAAFGGFFLAVSCGLLVLIPSKRPIWEFSIWALFALGGSLWWVREVDRHWQRKWSDCQPTRAMRCHLACASFLTGLLWSAPSMIWLDLFAELQLQAYTWLAMAVTAFICASIPMQTIHLTLLLGGTLIPIAWAWSQLALPADGGIFNVLLAGGWAVCTYLQQRAKAFAERALRIARERATIVQELAQRNRMLEAANRSKIRILATASHEIRQPVHALGLLLERLRVDPEAQQLRAQVDDIGSIVLSLSHSLGLLLDISKLDEGMVTVQRSRFPAATLLHKLEAEHDPAAAAKGLKLSFSQAPDAWLDSDATLLYSILSNLVSNAIRYTDRGEVEVRCERRGDRLFFDVVDTGRGIPPAFHESVFREYVRLDRENQASQGFGLGLAIVRRTAELIDASVSLESSVGTGSRFTVALAAAAPADSSGAPSSDIPVLAGGTLGPALVGVRVMVVDNDPVVLRGMDAMLRSWGCKPIVATGIDELEVSLKHLSPRDVELVIADYHLGPGVSNGMDVIERVREVCGTPIPAALLTGDLSIRAPQQPFADHVHVLHKPVLPSHLRRLLEQMVNEAELRGSGVQM